MNLSPNRAIVYVFLGTLIFFLAGCRTAKTVDFKTPVDTSTKRIQLQTKQTYQLNDLQVYASNEFDGARLNNFKKENDSVVTAVITPENGPVNNSPYYAFKIWTTHPKTVYLTFQYPKGYKHRYIPKLKTANSNWEIIDSAHVFKKDSIVTIKLNLDKEPLFVAAQEIQSSTHVNNWVNGLIKENESLIERIHFGKSNLGRNLTALDIGTGDKKNKPVIVLLTRQHPPEVTGYYAFQSFLKAIIEDASRSSNFLNKYRILAFPMMNPDGVDLGHWRHNAGGVDTNRDWSIYNQPEIKQTVKFITKELKKNDSKLVIGLDFHSTWYDVFYTNKIREGTSYPKFIANWFNALESNIVNYKVNEKSSNSTKPVSKGWFLYGHNAVGITYEIGDATPRDKIKTIGRVTAEQMINILLNKTIN